MKKIKAADCPKSAALKKMLHKDGKQLNNTGAIPYCQEPGTNIIARYLYQAFVVFVVGIIKTDLILKGGKQNE